MCGIVAVTGYKKALPLLINGLEILSTKVDRNPKKKHGNIPL